LTKKDYKKLTEVFNKHECEYVTVDGFLEQLPRHRVYYNILKRLVVALKADNPRFDADKFIRECG